ITGAIGVAAYLGAGTLYVHREPAFGALTVVWLLAASVPALAGRHTTVGLLGLAAAGVVTAVLTWRPAWFAHAVFSVLLAPSALAGVQVPHATGETTPTPPAA